MTKPQQVKAFQSTAEELQEFSSFFFMGQKGIQIDSYELVERLMKLGILRYEAGDKYTYLHIIKNVCEEVKTRHIADVFVKHIKERKEEVLKEIFSPKTGNLIDTITKKKLLSKVYKGVNSYFGDNIIDRCLPETPIRFQEHERETAYFYYKNGFVEVTKRGRKFKTYDSLNGCIWKGQILPRNYKEREYKKSNFYKFVENISEGRAEPTTATATSADRRKKKKKLTPRFDAMRSVIGYLLHSYYDSSLKAVVFTDSRISDDDEPKGRSGKSLICKAIGQMIDPDPEKPSVYVNVDGKKLEKSQFAMQEIPISAKLVNFNDLKKGFDVEYLFNDILDGIRVERKGKDPFKVKVKIVFSTNRLLKLKGASARARFLEFELSDYYSEDFRPDEEFGEWFFRDWNNETWQQFDSFMLDCIQYYFKNGLQAPPHINLLTRKLREETHPLFVEWLDFFFSETGTDPDTLATVILNPKFDKYEKSFLFEQFTQAQPDFDRPGGFKLKQNTFTKWVKLYAYYKTDIKEAKAWRSNSTDYIQLIPIIKQKDEDNMSFEDLIKLAP